MKISRTVKLRNYLLFLRFAHQLALSVEAGVANALVINVYQCVNQTLPNGSQLPHGNIALFELTIGDHAVHYFLDYCANILRSRFIERSDRGFSAIGEHQDDRLFGLRFRSGITEIIDIYNFSTRFRLSFSFVIDVGEYTCAVMLRNEIDDLRGQVCFRGHADPAPHVAGDYPHAVER